MIQWTTDKVVMQMNKEKAVSYISGIPKFTTKNSLGHTREFLARLGNPEKGRKIIHVAGTNGKGSVCAYMQAVLLAKGKRTGMFTSPHLIRMNERIKIDGEDILDDAFLRAFMETLRVTEEMKSDGIAHPTYFEFLFGMAMYAFAEADVEYIILETGIGGRLDATNAVKEPAVTVITSISLDHTDILGESVKEIAEEKAGIIKPYVPVVFADGAESTQVIERTAANKKASCIKISKNAYEILKIGNKYIDFSTASAYDRYTTWKLNNIGIYQAENAMLAIKAMECLFPEEDNLDLWREAFQNTVWRGRMEEIFPGVIIDGAHNIAAVEAFANSIEQRDGRKCVILFSAVRDKKYKEMIECLCRKVKADAYIITEIKDVRGIEAEAIAEVFRQYTETEVLVEKEIQSAFWKALERRGSDGRLYCLGSLYLVGMLEELKGGSNNA